MQGRMIGKNPIKHESREEFKEDVVVWRILYNGGIQGFVDALQGFDENWS